MFKILTKTNPEGKLYFELYNEETKQTVTSSDLFFDPEFFKKNWSDEEFSNALRALGDKFNEENTHQIKNFEIKNGNTLISFIATELLSLKPELKKIYDATFSEFMKGERNSVRIHAVCFHLLQFMTQEYFINGNSKLFSLKEDYKACNESIWLDGFYFYGVEKVDQHESHLRSMLASIKNFQDRSSINDLINIALNPLFDSFVKRKDIDTIAVIPNNAVRKVSFNEEIQKYLKTKYSNLQFIETSVNDFPERKTQKSTRGLCERIENADKLMSVKLVSKHTKNILLIDDVFGSGATMNMVAKKIKALSPDTNIIGFAILSSYRKGFDVISEI